LQCIKKVKAERFTKTNNYWSNRYKLIDEVPIVARNHFLLFLPAPKMAYNLLRKTKRKELK